LTEEEYERLQCAAKSEGYTTVSTFIRAVTIGDKRGIMLQIQDDVRSILKKLEENEKGKR
jgi:hypothetical protein